ncbi:glycosyltransferase [archaeon]|nr:MAG: glycosyltransferase [archaeon]
MFLNHSLSNRNQRYEVVIVEDNSPDGTLDAAKQLQKIFGKDKVIIKSRPGKMGLGSAYIDGLQLCTGNYIFLMDADMSHHPRHMSEFIK